MARFARSSRGEVVDFDLLEIKKALGMTPAPVSDNDRRQFINAKEGVSQTTLKNTQYLDQLQVPLGPQSAMFASLGLEGFPEEKEEDNDKN